MSTRRQLANALRALSMDAVQKATPDTRACRWAWPTSPRCCGGPPEAQPGNPEWADRDRFRAVERPRFDAALLVAAPDGLSARPRAGEEFPPVWRAYRGPPGGSSRTSASKTTTGPLVRAWRTPSAWRSPRSCSPRRSTVPATRWSTTAPGVRRRCCLMEASRTRPARWPARSSSARLICFYDDNGISIDGDVEGLGLPTTRRDALRGVWLARACATLDRRTIRTPSQRAIEAAKADGERPSLICCKTVIGWGSPTRRAPTACMVPRSARRKWPRRAATSGWPDAPVRDSGRACGTGVGRRPPARLRSSRGATA